MFLTLVFMTSVFAFALPTQAQEVDPVAEGYTEIVGSGASGQGAVGLIFANICSDPRPIDGDDPCSCRAVGKCSLDDALQVFVNVMTLILGIIGSLILLVFFWGGFTWVTSYGHPNKIEAGKQAMSNAIIGLAIVLGSYVLLNFVIATITAGDLSKDSVQEQVDKTQ